MRKNEEHIMLNLNVGEDISEKLNFRPAPFYKEQHVRGKWVCDQCDTLTQQAMPAYVIDNQTKIKQ